MGLFDSFKNVFGGKAEGASDVTKAPSQLLREAGIDPSGLKFGFGGDGAITVSGRADSDSDRLKILKVLSAVPGVSRVDDQMTVAAAPLTEPSSPASVTEDETSAADAGPAATVAESAAEEARTYTVKSGDTLWKIAEKMYGNGSKYMKIFDANSDLLEHPDRIFPGQKLVVPD